MSHLFIPIKDVTRWQRGEKSQLLKGRTLEQDPCGSPPMDKAIMTMGPIKLLIYNHNLNTGETQWDYWSIILNNLGSLTEVFYTIHHHDNNGATRGRTQEVNGDLCIILKCAEFDPRTSPPCADILPENAIIWKFTVRFKRDNSILQENGSLLATWLSAPLA